MNLKGQSAFFTATILLLAAGLPGCEGQGNAEATESRATESALGRASCRSGQISLTPELEKGLSQTLGIYYAKPKGYSVPNTISFDRAESVIRVAGVERTAAFSTYDANGKSYVAFDVSLDDATSKSLYFAMQRAPEKALKSFYVPTWSKSTDDGRIYCQKMSLSRENVQYSCSITLDIDKGADVTFTNECIR